MNFLLRKIAIACVVMSVSSVSAKGKGYSDPIERGGDRMMLGINVIGLAAALVYEDGYQGVYQFAATTLVTQLLTEGLKKTVGKERPNGNCCNSFPSGHASGAFAGATFINQRYGWEYGVPAYIGATFVAYSRVDAEKHYWEDVMAGAALGVAVGYLFTTEYDKMNVMPMVTPDYMGIQIQIMW